MTKTITGSLLVCGGAALFAAGALLFNDASPGAVVPNAAAPARVDIANFAFSSATVAPGATLTIANGDGEAHTVTARSGLFDTHAIAGGKTVTLTAPSAPGTYAFFCTIHPSMRGELIVQR